MTLQDFIDGLRIPPRYSNHSGTWVALYLDMLPGSGEHICIGVIATDGTATRSIAVPHLERLQSVYGTASQSIAWSARLAMLEATSLAEVHGIESLHDRLSQFEGLSVGPPRSSGGRDLDDVADLALRQSSTLVACHDNQAVTAMPGSANSRPSPIAKAVRRSVLITRPELKENFDRHFGFEHHRRPTVYGFVGRRLVANFAMLGGDSADVLGRQLDTAKARLWDLEQLQQGVLKDVLGKPLAEGTFELLACPPVSPSRTATAKRPLSAEQLAEAADTLEREADKFDIRWRFMANPLAIATHLIGREAIN